MKKKISVVLIAVVVLLAAALVMKGTVGLNNKLTNGGCAVSINVGSTYDAETVKGYVASAGFNSPVILEASKTTVELETGAMAEDALSAAADKLLASVQADYAGAALVYAESFEAPQNMPTFRNMFFALIAFAVVGYVYGALRFGWCKGIVPVLTALVAAVVTSSVCMLLSAVLNAGAALSAIVAGSAALTYVYSIFVCGKMKANSQYSVAKSDMAVPVFVVVAAVLLTVSCGSISTMLCAVIASVVAAAGMHCLAPMFWGVCRK